MPGLGRISARTKPRRDGRAVRDGCFLAPRPLVLLLTNSSCSRQTSHLLTRDAASPGDELRWTHTLPGSAGQQLCGLSLKTGIFPGSSPTSQHLLLGVTCWGPRSAGSVPCSQRGCHGAEPGARSHGQPWTSAPSINDDNDSASCAGQDAPPGRWVRAARQQRGVTPSPVPRWETRPCERNTEKLGHRKELPGINRREIKSPSVRVLRKEIKTQD